MAAVPESVGMSPFLRQPLAQMPDLRRLAALDPARYPCLLESVVHDSPQSRWDLLLAFPQSRLVLDAGGSLHLDGEQVDDHGFLGALDRIWQDARTPAADDGLPFHGGWALYLAYELAQEIEPSLSLPAPPGDIPAAMAVRCPVAVLIDHEQGKATLVAERGHAAAMAQVLEDIRRTSSPALACATKARVVEEPDQAFLDAVERAQDYIRAGDVFQVNLSRQWQGRLHGQPGAAAVYQALCGANPAPFACLWQQPGWAVISSSPERLLEVRGSRVQTRPIAGTRPRHAGDNEQARIDELMAHPKERAEHVMLIDLERNDLGRVCQPGSVEVNDLMVVESHPHVHHIVSNVRGILRPDVTPGQVIRACFPGGTITGCPKVRCMEIIAELEGVGRGPYTGSVGYLDRNGDLDLNILIRTFVQRGDELSLRAGAGIVHDSVASAELEETRAKARGLLCALGAVA